MTNKNDGGPAFASAHLVGTQYQPHAGMTLRDWFAGRVMSAIWAEDCATEDEGMTLDEMAHEAYRMADAMLAERDCV